MTIRLDILADRLDAIADGTVYSEYALREALASIHTPASYRPTIIRLMHGVSVERGDYLRLQDLAIELRRAHVGYLAEELADLAPKNRPMAACPFVLLPTGENWARV